jgi:beta-lactamase class A
VARFLVMLDRGELVSPWASGEMKAIMAHPAIHHKFVLGLDARPDSRIFRKSGTWRNWHADAAIVERDGKKSVAVALLETSATGILAQLIVKLDDLIHRAPARRQPASREDR